MSRVAAAALALACCAAFPTAAWAQRAELARARTLYNERNFDAAIDAALVARKAGTTADAAAIVQARAHLERYRERANPDDLSAARAALTAVSASALSPRDRTEFLLALGESLFLEDDFGAAAETFEVALDKSAVDSDLRPALLDWWASAIERLAHGRARDERREAFARVIDRMSDEIAREPSSGIASYWLVVALRGAGQTNRAWDAAVAGWARARLMGDRTAAFRSDLNRVVLDGIIPDRLRTLPQDQRPAAEAQLKADWELVKGKWK